MNMGNKPKIDGIDRAIVQCLRQNSRLSMREIGERVHLSGQAVANRIVALEDAGVLKRFTINVDCPEFGYPVHALVRFRCVPDKRARILELACGRSIHGAHHMLRCYRTSGEYEYMLDMVFVSMQAINDFLDDIELDCEKEVLTVLRDLTAFGAERICY